MEHLLPVVKWPESDVQIIAVCASYGIVFRNPAPYGLIPKSSLGGHGESSSSAQPIDPNRGLRWLGESFNILS